MEWLLSQTALPNFHPALVHFPLVLVPLAILLEALGLVLRKKAWPEPATSLVYGLALLSAFVALRAGESAADGLEGVQAQLQVVIAEHSDWAHYALWALAALAPLRILLHYRDPERRSTSLRVVALVAGLVVQTLFLRAADLGGALVYRHGLGVAPHTASPATASPDTDGPPADLLTTDQEHEHPAAESTPSLLTHDDGRVVFTPRGADASSALVAIGAEQGRDFELEVLNDALVVTAHGTGLLALPGTFGDVEVATRLRFEDFRGTVGLFHHGSDAENHSGLSLSESGEALLYETRNGRKKELGQGAASLPEVPFRLAASAAGRHLKGLLDGKTVVHGHTPSGPAGSVGLRFDGQGTFRLLELEVTPLEQP